MERKSLVKFFFAIACVTLLASACCSKKHVAQTGIIDATAPVKELGYAGVLKNMAGLDGCKWMILLNDGTKIQPTNLAAFDIALEDGKAVNVEYTEQTGVMSTCMAGKVVKITKISIR